MRSNYWTDTAKVVH